MSSVAFDKIVPFGQNFVLDDMPVTLTLKERVTFFLCLIKVSVDSRKYSESRLGSCLGSHIASLLDGVEDGSAPYSGNLREEHVLYGIPLGAVRRIVGNPNVETQSCGCFHEAPLELPASGIVGPPPSQRIQIHFTLGYTYRMCFSHCSTRQSQANSAVS